MPLKPTLFITGLTALLMASSASARYHQYDDEWTENYTVQALLGAIQYNSLTLSETDSEGETAEVDLALIPQLGGAWSTLPKGNRFQYGLECSLLLGFRLERINYFSAGGSGLHVSISSSMWTFDLAGGAYANLKITDGVRLYAAAGPQIIYADYRSERTEDSGAATDDTYNNNTAAFGVGLYARTGVECRVQECGFLGLSFRGNWVDVDFSEVGGGSNMTGIAGFFTYTVGL